MLGRRQRRGPCTAGGAFVTSDFNYHRARVYRWAAMWGQAGIGFGIPNDADLQELMAIWDGKA